MCSGKSLHLPVTQPEQGWCSGGEESKSEIEWGTDDEIQAEDEFDDLKTFFGTIRQYCPA